MYRFLIFALCVGWLSPAFAYEFKGAGATFPTLLFQKMFAQYKKDTGHTVHYTPVGSGKGLSELASQNIDFAVSEIQEFGEASFAENHVQIPVTIGAVSIIYRLPGNPVLKFSPSVVSDIFQGKISTWNDPRIQDENKGVSLPNLPIQVVIRGDRSGTTSLLTAYLVRSSQSWGDKRGVSSTMVLSGSQRVGDTVSMVKRVKETVGAIGYSEWHYAVAYDVSIAAVRNAAGNYVQPSIDSVSAFSMDSRGVTPDPTFLVSTGNQTGVSLDVYAYPITGYSYIVVHRDQKHMGDIQRARGLVSLLWWMTHEGQIYAESLGFPPLAQREMRDSTQLLRGLHFNDILLR